MEILQNTWVHHLKYLNSSKIRNEKLLLPKEPKETLGLNGVWFPEWDAAAEIKDFG